MLGRLATCVAFVCLASPARGQFAQTLPVERGTIERLVKVPAHEARCVALDENRGLLALGHEHSPDGALISLHKLGADGLPGGEPVSWKLPFPADMQKSPYLKKQPAYPLALAFHPKLPLLYVWQDFGVPMTRPNPPAVWTSFDHLHIYDIGKDTPALVVSLCRGKDYIYGQGAGVLAVDPGGEFLYVPNFRDTAKPIYWHVGRFPLDADGLPRVLEKEVPLADRIEQLTSLNEQKSLLPAERTPGDYIHNFPVSGFGSAQSIHFVSPGTILLGGYRCVLTWRPQTKGPTVLSFPVKYSAPSLIAAHPKLPCAYVTKSKVPTLLRVEHVEGNWSLVPGEWTLPQPIGSAPIVLPKTNQLVVGGAGRLYLIELDGEGQPRKAVETEVPNLSPRGLVYSEKFDRIYVAVEGGK